jgi:PAP_fibrillin.
MKSSALIWAVGLLLSTIHCSAFAIHRKGVRMRTGFLKVVAVDVGKDLSVTDIKNQIDNKIRTTKRGVSATSEQQSNIDALIQCLEKQSPIKEPARSPLMGGNWIVEYTTAPPPSNGKLGPFCGFARQVIDLENKKYINYLSVPGDVQKEWLCATLEATFEEWDGEYLPAANDGNSIEDGTLEVGDARLNTERRNNLYNWLESLASMFQPKRSKYSTNSWKVNFKTLTIRVLGFQVVRKTFDEGTSRVWQMTYLDETGTRIGK